MRSIVVAVGAEEEQIRSRREQRTCRGYGRSSSRGAAEVQMGGEKEQCRRRGEHGRSRGGEMEEHVGAEE
jgi:hypothetical protein